MPFISELTGKVVTDVDGARVGRVEDIIATLHSEQPHPIVSGLAVRRGRDLWCVSMADVAVLVAPAVPLKRRAAEITPYVSGDNDLYLVRDVLDKQIIDTNGVRVVRVNDVELTQVNGHFYVANVDVGGLGLLRRLGAAGPVQHVATRFGRDLVSNCIRWDDVELLPGNQPLRLKVPGERLSELHPADLAEIISDLSRAEGSKVLEALDLETVADALEEVEPDFQASLVESMSDEKVADLLEEMAPDEAADLLAELPEDRSEELLSLMDREDAAGVRKLLSYPEDSAGGLMTSEYVVVSPDLTAERAIAYLRETADEAETIYYVYVTDSEQHLIGVFSLQDLVLAKPETTVSQFMHTRVVSAGLLDSQESLAQAIAKYSLLALPVVDEEGRMHGIVTSDDALDKIIPTAWKKRLPRVYR
jgi:magnesium transporter